MKQLVFPFFVATTGPACGDNIVPPNVRCTDDQCIPIDAVNVPFDALQDATVPDALAYEDAGVSTEADAGVCEDKHGKHDKCHGDHGDDGCDQ